MSENQPNERPRIIERSPKEIRRYARRRYLLLLGHLLVGAAYLVGAVTVRGPAGLGARARALAGPNAFHTGVFVYFTLFSLGYLMVTLPLRLYSEHILEHQFGLSTQTLGRWAKRRIKKWVFSFVIAAPLVVGFYAALRRWPETWWVPAAIGWILVAYVFTRFAPRILIPLFYTLEPIDDEGLSARLTKLASDVGVRLRGVYRLDLSRETNKANAAVVGMGSSRRVVLGDTLLARFTPDEITTVFAHEVGHIVHHDLAKGFCLFGVLCTGSLYVASLVLERASAALGIGHVYDPQTLPILIAVFAALQLLVLPLDKWYSRRRELSCDAYAVRTTRDRESFIGAMRKLGAMNLADVRPNRIAEIFLFSHPPISKRICFAATLNMDPEP